MPYGKGTYGSRVGRPARKKKDTKSVKRLARNTATANQEGEGRVYGMGEESGLEDYRRGSKKTRNGARRKATSKTGISAHSVESGEVHFDPNRPGQERSSRVQVSKRGPIVRISRR